MIIGITGTLGAGKGTVVEYLKEKGFKHYSASGLLKELLLAEGKVPSRDTYSPLAKKIRTAYPGGIPQLLWEQIEKDNPENLVIEALHDIGEAQFVKDKKGILIGIDADIEVRYERSVKRGSEKDHVTLEEFKDHIHREEESADGHNIRAVLEKADHIILNEGTVEELYTQLSEILGK